MANEEYTPLDLYGGGVSSPVSNGLDVEYQRLMGIAHADAPSDHSAAGWEWESAKSNYMAGLANIGGALGSKTAEDYAQKMTAQSDLERSRSNAPHSWDEMEVGKNLGAYIRQGAIGSAPYMLEAAGYAGADALSGGALTPAILARYGARLAPVVAKGAIESGMARGLTREAAGEAAGMGLARSAMIPAVTYPSSLGDVLGNQYEQAERYDLPTAAALAVPYAAANAFGIEGAMARGMPANLLKQASEGGLKSAAMRGGAGALVLGGQEAGNETFQEMMNQAGRIAVDTDAEMFSPEAMARYKESAIMGGLLGGLPGGAHGAYKGAFKAGEVTPLPAPPGVQPVDLLATPATEPAIASELVIAPTPVTPLSEADRTKLSAPVVFQTFPDGTINMLAAKGNPAAIAEQQRRAELAATTNTTQGTPNVTPSAQTVQAEAQGSQQPAAAVTPAPISAEEEALAREMEPTAILPTAEQRLAAGVSPVAPGVKAAPTPAKPKVLSKAAAKVEAAFAEHIAAGTLAADDPVVAQWHAGKKTYKEAVAAGRALGAALVPKATANTDAEKLAAGWTKKYTKVLPDGTPDEATASWIPPKVKGKGNAAVAPDAIVVSREDKNHELVTPEGRNNFIQAVTEALTPEELATVKEHLATDLVKERTPEYIVRLHERLVAEWSEKHNGEAPGAKVLKSIADRIEAMEQAAPEDRVRGALRVTADELGVSHATVRNRVNSALSKIDAIGAASGLRAEEAQTALGLKPDSVSAHMNTVSAAEAAQMGLSTRGRGGGSTVNRAESDDFDHTAGFARDEETQTGAEVAAAKELEEETGKAPEEKTFDPDGTETLAVDSTVQHNPLAYMQHTMDHEGHPITPAAVADAVDEWNHREDTPLHEQWKGAWVQLFVANHNGVLNDSKFQQYYRDLAKLNDETPAATEAESGGNDARAEVRSSGRVDHGVSAEEAAYVQKAPAKPITVVAKKKRAVVPQVDVAGTKWDKGFYAEAAATWDKEVASVQGVTLWEGLSEGQKYSLLTALKEDTADGPATAVAAVVRELNTVEGEAATPAPVVDGKTVRTFKRAPTHQEVKDGEPSTKFSEVANGDESITLEAPTPIGDDFESAQAAFLSAFPKSSGYHHFKYGKNSTSRDARAASEVAQRDIDLDPLVGRDVAQPLGAFSGYVTRAQVGTTLDGKQQQLTVNVYGKEQIEQGLTDQPALKFTVAEDGELSIYGPPSSSKTYNEFVSRGWAEPARDKDGEPHMVDDKNFWTRLTDSSDAQSVQLLGDVHARMLALTGAEQFGFHWVRTTGATGGTTQRKGAMMFSEGDTQGSTAQKITGTLKKLFFSPQKFDQVVTIHQTAEEAQAADPKAMSEAKNPNRVQAFVGSDGKVHLIAGNIAEGQELGVFLHEVGVHLGMQKLIGKANMAHLTAQINKWAEKNDGSQESKIAKAALARAEASSSTDTSDELIAYFIEEAVAAGVNPQAVAKTNSPLGNWFRSLWAAAKLALRKIGLGRFDQLTAQNLVDLAYGSAKMELTGSWHGTAASFRNFDHKFMDSGEGAQAFGWGTYLAQAPGIAHGYWQADVARKTKRRDTGNAEVDNLLDISDSYFPGVHLTQEILGVIAQNMNKYKMSAEDWAAVQAFVKNNPDGVPSITPEGSLMRVDTAVHDDEMLDWYKPLSEQIKRLLKAADLSAVTTEHAKKFARSFDITPNEGAYRSLTSHFTGENLYKELKKHLDSDKATSEYLDSIGIKGIKFLDANSRNSNAAKGYDNYPGALRLNDAIAADAMLGFDDRAAVRRMLKQDGLVEAQKNYDMSPELVKEAKSWLDWLAAPVDETRNLVIFNDKNIQRVMTEVGASTDKIKFSEANAPVTTLPEVESFTNGAIQALRSGASLAPTMGRAGAVAKDVYEKALHALMFTHDVVQAAVKQGLGSAEKYDQLLGQMDQMRNKLEVVADQIMLRASKLTDRPAVEQFLKDSTVSQKWGYTDNPSKMKADPGMSARFNALSSEGQQVVREIFQNGNDNYELVRALSRREIDREYDALIAEFPTKKDELEKDRVSEVKRMVRTMPQLQGPYAPLRRFGDHVVVAKSAAFIAAEAAKDTKETERLESHETEIHKVVEFFPDAGAAAARKAQLDPMFASVAAGNKQKVFHQVDSLPWLGITKIKSAIDDSGDMKYKESMKRMVTEMYLKMLAESSARKSELSRKGTRGAADMFQAFADHAGSNANFIAQLDKSKDIHKQLTAMKNEAAEGKKSGNDLNIPYNELAARYAQGLEYSSTPLADKALRATSIWMLLSSPAYYLTNATQTYMVTMPVLGGRYGHRAFSEITKAYKDVAAFVGAMGHEFNLDDPKLPLSAGERQMLKDLRDQGKLDITIKSDLGRWSEGSADQGVVARTLQKMNNAVGKVETLNRITSALAAYRLSGSSKYAGEIVDSTQGNYSGGNAPRFFHKNAATKLITQFRKYQLIQATLIAKLAKDSFKGASAEERAVARKTFAWLMTQQLLVTGIKGAPIPALLLILAGALGGDDDKDWERNARKAIGDDQTADLLLHGIPAATGLDLSGRVGMGNAFSIMPFTDFEVSKKGYKEAVFGLSGAAIGGLGGSMFDGVDKISKGDYRKGIEAMLPRGLKDGMAGYRLATEGVTNTRGDVNLRPDEITVVDGMMKALGLPTTALTNTQRQRNDLYDLGTHFHNKDSSMKNAYAAAVREGDTEKMADLRDKWTETQASKKEWVAEMTRQGLGAKELVTRIKPQPLSTLLKAPQAQAKREKPYAGLSARY